MKLNSFAEGDGCSKTEDHTPRDPKAVGSNPDGYWAFFSSFSLINVINSLSEVQLYSLSLLRNVQIEAKQVKCA